MRKPVARASMPSEDQKLAASDDALRPDHGPSRTAAPSMIIRGRLGERRNSAPARRVGRRSYTHSARPPNAEQVFRLRCWARAALYAAGEIDLIEAVDELQDAAAATGLVACIGQDAVQHIIASAFGDGR